MKHVRGFFRMMGALFGGRYRKAPWRSGVMLGVFAVYLVIPLDAIIDAIPVLGFVDDAAVFGFFVAALKKDVDRFLEWEGQKKE
jgi:uncharacterized membrane protein YkvA (DUF1232 family)